MLIFERKPFEVILEPVKEKEKILLIGCGTCPSVRLAGGEREVETLAAQLELALGKKSLTEVLKRQCDPEFFSELEMPGEDTAILSLACGMGVQLAASVFELPVFPVNNTLFIGTPVEQGVFEERCQACGDCVVYEYGNICPVARCAKNLMNGPCGGSSNGKCEVSRDTACAWQLIYDNLKKFGKLDSLKNIRRPKDWRSSASGEPGRIAREDLRTY